MNYKKNEAGNLLPMTVCEGVTVNVLPSAQHEYLMTTKEVANGYGTTRYVIQKALYRNNAELQEGKHFVIARTFCPHDTQNGLKLPHNAILWTKRGIVRLGFFIKSDRAKLFRDWAEELIIKVDELAGATHVETLRATSLPKKRNHNRLTSDRLIRLLQLTHRINDAALRNEIVEQLMGGT
jgi:hypothetical protein